MVTLIVIDTDKYEANGIRTFKFPGGEWHAEVPSFNEEPVTIFAKIRTWDDFGKLLVVMSAISCQPSYIHLFIPYFPGARQDRNPGGNTPLTVQVYMQAITPYVSRLTVLDVHSAAAGLVLAHWMEYNSLVLLDSAEIVKRTVRNITHVIAPDDGAQGRAQWAADALGVPVITCGKKRDFATGALSGFTVPELPDNPWWRNRYLIVDDICDGGGTFVGLLNEIRKQELNAPVDLFVAHGIFSKGFGPLSGFDNIYTTDSFFCPDHGTPANVHVFKLLPYFLGGSK